MTNTEIRALLDKMTVRQKVAQLLQLNANLLVVTDAEITGPAQELNLSVEDIYTTGNVLNFTSALDVIRIQNEHMKNDPNKIPMLFMMDVIHGYKTTFPIPLGMGASFDAELLKECTAMSAKEAVAGGIQVTFTPMVDFVRDARWGRVMESCGEDVYLNSIMGAAQVEAFQGDLGPENIGTCVKHFAAYGGAEAGRDYNLVEISERTLREYYFPAYKACLDAGATSIMPSFNSLNGVPSVANKWLMNDVLRGEWGYDGLVISDYNAIGELLVHGVAENSKDAAEMAFNCGCDIDMNTNFYPTHMEELIAEGKVTMEALDHAVLKVLELKNKLGMFEDPLRGASYEKEKEICLCPEHRALVRRAVEECAVLLKNDGVLPFSKETKKIALIGPFAEEQAISGFWSCNAKPEDCINVYNGVKGLLPDAEVVAVRGCSAEWNELSEDDFERAIEAARAADAVVLCLGEPQNYSGEGNCRTDLTLPGVQTKLARKVVEANPNTAAIIFNGRPLALTELDEVSPAILDVWFTGVEGGPAVANLLFGEANPSGKLTMTFPRSVGQCPIYYNRVNTGRPKTKPDNERQIYASTYLDCGNLPLYSFGHGLSYTTFEYLDMTLENKTMSDKDPLKVNVTVRNAGERAGKEVVQLYIHDRVASTVRPVQSLAAFKKISLDAGEVKTVQLEIPEERLRFYNDRCECVSEAGWFDIFVGYADHPYIEDEFFLEKFRSFS